MAPSTLISYNKEEKSSILLQTCVPLMDIAVKKWLDTMLEDSCLQFIQSITIDFFQILSKRENLDY